MIGLGHFGASLARRLEALGHTVLGIDNDMARVQAIADDISAAMALDATDENALQEADIGAFNTVIVALGEGFEDNALITAYLKSLKIERVICLAETSRHRNILLRIGADQVILSEEDSGIRLAETLAAPNMLERVFLDNNHSLIEFVAPASLAGQSLAVFARYEATVLLIQRRGALFPNPGSETELQLDDILFAVGPRDKLLEVARLP